MIKLQDRASHIMITHWAMTSLRFPFHPLSTPPKTTLRTALRNHVQIQRFSVIRSIHQTNVTKEALPILPNPHIESSLLGVLGNSFRIIRQDYVEFAKDFRTFISKPRFFGMDRPVEGKVFRPEPRQTFGEWVRHQLNDGPALVRIKLPCVVFPLIFAPMMTLLMNPLITATMGDGTLTYGT